MKLNNYNSYLIYFFLGFPSFSSGGFDSYGGGSFTGGFSHSAAAAPVPPPLPALPAPSIPDLGSGPDPSLIQSGGDGGDFHGGISIIGGGGAQQGQTLDLTGHGEHLTFILLFISNNAFSNIIQLVTIAEKSLAEVSSRPV